MNQYNNTEFLNIIEPIINSKEFSKLKLIQHHGDNRYNHCMRVAYHTYCITKKMHLHYEKATEAALLHDFFSTEVKNENGIARLRRHPEHALENAIKYFDLDDMQKDIIKTHMFPITFTPPKYLESWIVDIVDDIVALYEKYHSTKKELVTANMYLFLVIMQIFGVH